MRHARRSVLHGLAPSSGDALMCTRATASGAAGALSNLVKGMGGASLQARSPHDPKPPGPCPGRGAPPRGGAARHADGCRLG